MSVGEMETVEAALKSALLNDLAARAAGKPSGPAASGLRAWNDYVDLLRPAADVLAITWFPEDEQTRAELYRQLVMNLAQGYVWFFQSTPEHPDWMPFENSIFLLQPNPDAIYHMAPVSGRGVYRVVGKRGTTRVMGFATSPIFFGSEEPTPGFNNYDADGLTIGADGSFEVIFSSERPADWTGDWRFLHPESTTLLIRQFAYDWAGEEDARFAIERLDVPALKPRPSAAEIASRLDSVLGNYVRRFSRICLSMQNELTRRVGFNTMDLTTFVDMGNSGEWPQVYWRSIFECEPGAALILETELPKRCHYWNVQLNDTLWNQIEYGYRQSSLNGHQARLDSDGKFRAVLSPEDPGVPNWLDPGGFQRGMLIGRWYGADSHPTPTIRQVPLSEIRKHLPPDTPATSADERDKAIRLRNFGLQMRRRW
jgi:hypothetical protein